MTTIYTLLVGHFIADFIAQSDWMALNKSKRWDALGVHVLVYSVVLGLCMVPWWTPHRFGAFVLVNTAAHFVQDALTSRLTSRLWFFKMEEITHNPYCGVCANWQYKANLIPGYRHWFFVAIGFDQLLHYATLFSTAGWWLQ